MRRSGKYAYVDGISCVTGWAVDSRSSVGRYSASCSPGGTATSEGNINETGTMEGIGYAPPLPSEDDYPFVGVASAKAGQIINHEGNILIYETTLNIPVAAGGPITWTSAFGVQGELVEEVVTPYVDPSRIPGPSAKNGGVRIENLLDTNTFTTVEGVQAITLTFRMPPVDSVEAGSTLREAGNLEVDLSFEVHNDDRYVDLYEENSIHRTRVYVTDTLFYLLDSIQFSEKTNYRVRRNPPEMIGYTVVGMWTALRTRTPEALGEILLPDGSVYYGETS